MSVCPLAYLKNHTSTFNQSFLYVTCSHGSLLLWRQRNMLLCASSIVNDVVFSHNAANEPESNTMHVFRTVHQMEAHGVCHLQLHDCILFHELLLVMLGCQKRMFWNKQGVTLTGCNCTGPPCSVSHQTAHAPCPAAADCPRARPARRQRYRWRQHKTPTTTDNRHQRAKQYWPIRRASNKTGFTRQMCFLLSNCQCQSTKGISKDWLLPEKITLWLHCFMIHKPNPALFKPALQQSYPQRAQKFINTAKSLVLPISLVLWCTGRIPYYYWLA